jgi:hypothetical protein
VILEDFVMLGTTVPEPNSDGRVFVCSAGISPEYRNLIRIYPLARRHAPRRWAVHRVQLERNPRDSRKESFQLAGNRNPGAHQWINYKFDVVRSAYPEHARTNLLSPYVIGSIQEANAKRLSLAIIQPESMELNFEANPAPENAPQLSLFEGNDGELTSGARRFQWMPRIAFNDECGAHNLMLRDWGAFELQRKHEEQYFRQHLADALHLQPDSSLLVGNMNNQRTTWLVISVINQIREPPTLFDIPVIERSAVTEKVRREVYQRDGWRCVKCGASEEIAVGPREGVATSETYRRQDLETLCHSCIIDGGG